MFPSWLRQTYLRHFHTWSLPSHTVSTFFLCTAQWLHLFYLPCRSFLLSDTWSAQFHSVTLRCSPVTPSSSSPGLRKVPHLQPLMCHQQQFYFADTEPGSVVGVKVQQLAKDFLISLLHYSLAPKGTCTGERIEWESENHTDVQDIQKHTCTQINHKRSQIV